MADAAAPVTPALRGPDILVRTAPPLSATSDAPLAEIAKPPPSASNDPADQTNGVPTEMSPQDQAAARTARVVDPDAPTPAADPGAGQDEPKPGDGTDDMIETIHVDGKDVSLPPWMKREITKARNRQRDAETAAKTAADELVAMRASIAELKAKVETKPAEPVQPVAEDIRPTRDTFDDPDAYDTALTEWAQREGERKAAEKIAAEVARTEQEAAARQAEALKAAQDAEATRLSAAWEVKRAKATEKYGDYEQVTNADDLQITPIMAVRITRTENGADVAYYLGQNKAEAARIAAMTDPTDQVAEIALIASRLATPAARAPRARPLEPVDTGNAPSDTSQREPSMEEYGRRRTKEILGSRRPFMEPAAPARARA